jgi:hypothetical protein
MEDELELIHEEVISLLNELVSEGILTGSVSDDERRFWKSDIKLSDAPVLHRDEAPPDFLAFDTRPGMVVSLIGLLFTIGGFVTLNTGLENDIGAIVISLGIIMLLVGLYLISGRKTPD